MIAGGICHETNFTTAVSGSWKRETRMFETNMRLFPSFVCDGFQSVGSFNRKGRCDRFERLQVRCSQLTHTRTHKSWLQPSVEEVSQSPVRNKIQTVERPTVKSHCTKKNAGT